MTSAVPVQVHPVPLLLSVEGQTMGLEAAWWGLEELVVSTKSNPPHLKY